jgi:hypothetical protein
MKLDAKDERGFYLLTLALEGKREKPLNFCKKQIKSRLAKSSE